MTVCGSFKRFYIASHTHSLILLDSSFLAFICRTFRIKAKTMKIPNPDPTSLTLLCPWPLLPGSVFDSFSNNRLLLLFCSLFIRTTNNNKNFAMQVLYVLGDLTSVPAFRFNQWLDLVRKRTATYRSSGFPRLHPMPTSSSSSSSRFSLIFCCRILVFLVNGLSGLFHKKMVFFRLQRSYRITVECGPVK